MLGDNPEKSKNPLKKAMRRRNAKTVQFAAPQYFEPAEAEYSDEEDEESEDEDGPTEEKKDGEPQEARRDLQTDTATVKPLRLKSQPKNASTNGIQMVDPNDESVNGASDDSEKARTSDEMFEKKDSFFKDDTAETKKISLTPRLLRGNSEGETPVDVQDASLKSRSSFDTLEKVSSEAERAREDKKKKDRKQGDKKPGMLSGLFKRKDKKGRQDSETDDLVQISSEDSPSMSPQSKEPTDGPGQEKSVSKVERSPQRQSSKLQKAPPGGISPKTSPTKDLQQTVSSPIAEETRSLSQTSIPSTLRPVTSENQMTQPAPLNIRPSEASRDRAASQPKEKGSMYIAPLRSTRPESPTSKRGEQPIKPASQQPAKNPFSTDDSESATTDDDTPRPRQAHDRLSESPVEVSPIEQSSANNLPGKQPPPLMVDTSSTSEPQSQSPVRSSSSGSLVEAGTPRENDLSTDPTTTSPHADAATPSTARSVSSWSDASLRQYMDNDEDIRDLLIIVHDKSNVIPAGPEHPVTGNLFSAEKGRLAEMQTNLDNLLKGWLARKNGSAIPA
ncbi:MAG: hypothetical protein Q9227_005541 [Pyrenula ochraceoflavens]